MIKLRQTKERTPDSLVLEMPYNVKSPGNMWREGDPPRCEFACVSPTTAERRLLTAFEIKGRHMKMACGEVSSNTWRAHSEIG